MDWRQWTVRFISGETIVLMMETYDNVNTKWRQPEVIVDMSKFP